MKLNPAHAIFDGNMFVQLRSILEPIAPHPSLPMLDMSIGEPQMPPCQLLLDSVAKHNSAWQFYPKQPAMRGLLARFKIILTGAGQLPANWLMTRRLSRCRAPVNRCIFWGILLLAQTKCGGVGHQSILSCVAGWGAGKRAKIQFLDSRANHNFLPDLVAVDSDILARTTLLYLCSPTNPHGSIMDLDYLKMALSLARQHDFLVVMDECYSDIWRHQPPPGMIEAAAALAGDASGLDPLRNLVVLNSLSKRSGAAGLRAGFMVGDHNVIGQYLKLVGNGGSLVPTPLLEVAADLYDDDDHVAAIRSYYNANFDIAAAHLRITPPEGGFFLWLKVDDDIDFVQRLMAEQAVRALPGSFMAVATEVAIRAVAMCGWHWCMTQTAPIPRYAALLKCTSGHNQHKGFFIRWQ